MRSFITSLITMLVFVVMFIVAGVDRHDMSSIEQVYVTVGILLSGVAMVASLTWFVRTH